MGSEERKAFWEPDMQINQTGGNLCGFDFVPAGHPSRGTREPHWQRDVVARPACTARVCSLPWKREAERGSRGTASFHILRPWGGRSLPGLAGVRVRAVPVGIPRLSVPLPGSALRCCVRVEVPV